MSEQTTPAAQIQAAVEKLRAALDGAETISPPPWAVTTERVIRAANDDIVADRSAEDPGDDIDLPYIALMHPGLGRALLNWLDSLTGIEFSERAPMLEELHHALAIARQINGDPS
ncbi:hypothetical protein ACFWBI_08930 [Streptomyces sp. NPDC059982]|uniref:hypothetical protein n=1 Tax=unclassified Streptomyces TaxID=2593676 RepID=UPI00367900C0